METCWCDFDDSFSDGCRCQFCLSCCAFLLAIFILFLIPWTCHDLFDVIVVAFTLFIITLDVDVIAVLILIVVT